MLHGDDGNMVAKLQTKEEVQIDTPCNIYFSKTQNFYNKESTTINYSYILTMAQKKSGLPSRKTTGLRILC